MRDRTVSDRDVAGIIVDRFKECGVIVSFSEIARVARREERHVLAAQLLEHEVMVDDQVQMLVEMGETEKALDKAIDSWDSKLGK